MSDDSPLLGPMTDKASNPLDREGRRKSAQIATCCYLPKNIFCRKNIWLVIPLFVSGTFNNYGLSRECLIAGLFRLFANEKWEICFVHFSGSQDDMNGTENGLFKFLFAK